MPAAGRLPLPVDGPANAQFFEASGPPAAVLTGFLVPSSGPLTSWAPVFRVLGADGRLGAEQSGWWTGALPSRWIKVARADAVVAGMRVLVRTAPGPMQTRQLQAFWRAWEEGEPRGPVVESPVYGEAAAGADTVRIVELRVPDNAVAVGVYGLQLAGSVAEISLLVRVLHPLPVADAQPGAGPRAPSVPGFLPLMGPREPSVPPLGKPAATPLPNSP